MNLHSSKTVQIVWDSQGVQDMQTWNKADEIAPCSIHLSKSRECEREHWLHAQTI